MLDALVTKPGAAATVSTRPIVRPRGEPRPDALGAYRLYERLGVGGHASVYRARRVGESNACDVALKRLHPHLTTDADAIRAFGREARLAYLLDHPVIRRVYALGREGGELFMTMEYIDGASVFELLRRASAARSHFPLPGVLALLHRLCGALHYAHEIVDEHGVSAGFVHRDVSPSNVMIATGGRLKLIDMGVASATIDGQALGKPGIKGKYGYMAPEVMRRAPFDRRADVFSVGVVAWELLTLCRLYPVSKPPVDLELVRSRPIEAPSQLNRGCPAELDAIVSRALATDPGERWPSCAVLADALADLARHLGESISDTAIAELVELADDPGPRPRLARGTGPPSRAMANPLDGEPETASTPVPRMRRALALGGAGGAVAAVVVAGLAHSRIELPAVAAPRSRAPVAPVAPIARPSAPVVRPPTPVAPPPRAPDPVPPVRLAGDPPRSWSGVYPYRARLCIDVAGKVVSVAVLEALPRLETRIVRALRQWQYAPVDLPACFEVHESVEKVQGR